MNADDMNRRLSLVAYLIVLLALVLVAMYTWSTVPDLRDAIDHWVHDMLPVLPGGGASAQ